MTAYGGFTIRTLPFNLFLFEEFIHAVVPYTFEVLDHTHPVSCLITFIQFAQFFAGEVRAFIAELYLSFKK